MHERVERGVGRSLGEIRITTGASALPLSSWHSPTLRREWDLLAGRFERF